MKYMITFISVLIVLAGVLPFLRSNDDKTVHTFCYGGPVRLSELICALYFYDFLPPEISVHIFVDDLKNLFKRF